MNPVVVHTFYCSNCSYFSELSVSNPYLYHLEKESFVSAEIINTYVGKSYFRGIPNYSLSTITAKLGDLGQGIYRKIIYFSSLDAEIQMEENHNISFMHTCKAIQLCDNVKRVKNFAYQIFKNDLESKDDKLHGFVCGEEFGFIKTSFSWEECMDSVYVKEQELELREEK